MQMIHPLWPVVRESARRVVRSDEIAIVGSKKFSSSIIQLTNLISEKIPERSTFPIHIIQEIDEVLIYQGNVDDENLIVYIGNEEPAENVCWIEMEIVEAFSAVIDSSIQLLNAGYPGCVGCDGSMSEERWNEKKFRNDRKNSVRN